MSWTGQEDGVQIIFFYQPVEVNVGQARARIGVPVTEQTVLDVLAFERLAKLCDSKLGAFSRRRRSATRFALNRRSTRPTLQPSTSTLDLQDQSLPLLARAEGSEWEFSLWAGVGVPPPSAPEGAS